MTFTIDGTNGGFFPSWTTATRPASPSNGQMGYNTTTGLFDAYNGSAWVSIATTSQVVGISQTTADYTASRVLGTTYTNSTSKAIVVYASVSNAAASALVINQIDGTAIYGTAIPTANGYYGSTLVVPAGSTYIINMNGAPTLQRWVETR